MPGEPGPGAPPGDWSQWRQRIDLADYDERWRRLAAAGHNVHGEADLVCRYRPDTVLDAGCGTGRVAIELARRGVSVVGVDADPDMVAAARAKAPELGWRHLDLAELATDERFDLVVLAGNVIPYVAAQSRAAAVAACSRVLAPGGRLVAGFSLRPDWPSLAEYERWCERATLVREDLFATWDGVEPGPGPDYVVAVHRRRP